MLESIIDNISMLERQKQKLIDMRDDIFKIDPKEENKLISWPRFKRGAFVGFFAGIPSTAKTFTPLFIFERVSNGGIKFGPIETGVLYINSFSFSLEQYPFLPLAGLSLYSLTFAAIDSFKPTYQVRKITQRVVSSACDRIKTEMSIGRSRFRWLDS
jgi:hypothetical protein